MRRCLPPLRAPIALLLLLLALLASQRVAAAPAVQVLPHKDTARLLVHGKVIAILRKPNGELSPMKRAELAAERLRRLIAEGMDADYVEVRSRGESWGLYAAGSLLLVATPDEAGERNEEPKETARRWAANLKAALRGDGAGVPAPAANSWVARAAPEAGDGKKPVAKPPVPKRAPPPPPPPTLAVKDTSVVVPVGETRIVPLVGTAKGEIIVRSEDQETAVVAVVTGKSAVEVNGLSPGRAVIRVGRQGQETAFAVWVKKYAGRAPKPAEAEVTGDLTPASLVRRAAVEHALEGVEREPGTVVRLTGEPKGVGALAQGATKEILFPISITGEGYLPVQTVARVQVKNRPLPAQEAKLLLYSNDPESVREHGLLYEGYVDNSGPIRLLYHHQNRMGRPFVFQIHLLNPHNSPAEVQIIQGDAGPIIDTVLVGHRAGQRYMDAFKRNIGFITRVPARGVRTLYTTRIPQLETVSGIYNLRVTEGGPLVAQVTATAEPSQPTVRADDLQAARNEPHSYPSPQKQERYSYTVGERWTFVPMGRKAISGTSANRKLFGNYGVIYNITVDLNNPTNEERTVQVLMAPEAGWARGVFVIDGKLVEAPQVAPPAEATLWTVKLAPQEQRRVVIQGIPVGGSSYPVSLVVRS